MGSFRNKIDGEEGMFYVSKKIDEMLLEMGWEERTHVVESDGKKGLLSREPHDDSLCCLFTWFHVNKNRMYYYTEMNCGGKLYSGIYENVPTTKHEFIDWMDEIYKEIGIK